MHRPRSTHMEQRAFRNNDLICSAVGFGTWEMSTTQ